MWICQTSLYVYPISYSAKYLQSDPKPSMKLLTELMPLAKAKVMWMILLLLHVDSIVNNNDNSNPQSNCAGVGI